MKDVSESVVLAGHIDGPAHITGLEKTILIISCQQFRLHDSRNMDVYISCGTRPIIENCRDVRFAPVPEIYVRFLLFQLLSMAPMVQQTLFHGLAHGHDKFPACVLLGLG